jgi:hypothetical protein
MQAQQTQAMMSQFHMPPPLFAAPAGQPPPFLPFRPPPGMAPPVHFQMPPSSTPEQQMQG